MDGKQRSRQALSGADHAGEESRAGTPWREVLRFAPLWGVLACVGFYAAVPHIPFQQELLVRYTTSHPLEYITIALFFLGTATLVIRRLDLSREEQSLMQLSDRVRGVSRQASDETFRPAEALSRALVTMGDLAKETVAGRRVQEAVQYHQESDTTERLDDHLRHVADLEAERASQQFGFINTITWAVPILGFLGTVMGITLAIANVTPDQLDKSLPEVTGGLAVAFDTTALSLSLSLVLVFATFLVRRKQDEILSGVDRQLDHRLCYLLKKGTGGGPLRDHAQVSEHLVEASAQIVAEASALWRHNLSGLQTAFAESLQLEQSRVAEILRAGLTQTLDEQQALMHSLRDAESARQQQVNDHLTHALHRWETSVELAAERFSRQTDELTRHSEMIVCLVDKQQELMALQQQIHQSMDTQRIASTLDETLNSLTAAIQLLNARVNVSQRAA